jgi:hypothetical protein
MRAIAAEEALPPYVCLPEGTINLACNSGGGGGCQNQREGGEWEDFVHSKSLVPIFSSLLDFLGTWVAGLGLCGLGLCGLDLSVGLGPSPPSVHSALLALLSRFFCFFTSINIFCFQHSR